MKRSHLPGLLVAIATIAIVCSPAAAQDSSLLDNQRRIAVGDTVRSMVLFPPGTTGLADIYVRGYYPDDLTSYWLGEYDGQKFVYDTYSGWWKPAPVSYQHATLDFQGKKLEGWVRSFGPRLDRDVFIGRDGVVYKRINITKKVKRNGRTRPKVMYTYFINLATMQRSDGMYTSFYGSTEAEQILLRNQIAQREAALARQAARNPAFPKWNVNTGASAQQPAPDPSVVSVPATPTDEQQQSLAALIEEQIGPFQELGPQVKGDS